MDELLEQFLIEGAELVQQASDLLLALERRPADPELIDGAFRAIHTLKGSAGLFDYAPMSLVLHAAEDLLGAVRAGRRAIDRAGTDGLVAAVAQTERWLAAISRSGALPPDAPATADRLASRLRAGLSASAEAPPPASRAAAPDWLPALLAARPADAPAALVAACYRPSSDCFFRGDDPVAIARGTPGIVAFRVGLAEPFAGDAPYDPFRCNLVISLLSSAPPDQVRAAFRLVADQVEIVQAAAPAPGPEAGGEAAGEAGARTLRVDAARIDALVEIVDELVAAKNGLADISAQLAAGLDGAAAGEALAARRAALDRLVARLHRTVMGTRLVPVSPLFRRYPRLVREMAAASGKEVELVVDGGEVEADKTIVDGLFEPVTHLLRNAVDHGVEPPAERGRLGKPPVATLSLSARREGDRAMIEVRDDGRGIDPAVIRAVASRRGFMDDAALAALDDAEVLDLIFRPGFSTAGSVTDLSGRGVGMDAVRAAVTRLGGHVAVASNRGAGTTVTLTLPLNMVLTKVMVVACAGERYGVPMDAVVETARIPADRLVPIRAGRAFVLRDRTIPLLDLADLLGYPAPRVPGDRRALVVRSGSDLVAVGVEAFVDRMDVVLRPMSGLLSGVPGMVGTTLLGDGRVLMVLDLPELVA